MLHPVTPLVQIREKFLRMRFLLRLAVTVIVAGMIVWYLGDLGAIRGLIAQIKPLYVLLILIVITLDRALMAFKWGLLLCGRGVYLPFCQGLKIYCASMVWGMFLPATIGADAFRALSASRKGLDANEVVTSIIIERIVGFLSALLLGLCSLILLSLLGYFDTWFRAIWWLGSTVFVGTTILFAVSFSQRVIAFLRRCLPPRFRGTRMIRRLRRLLVTYQSYQNDKRNMVIFFGLTFFEQLIPMLSLWLIAQGLGIEVGLLYIAGAVPLAFLISRLPVSINGLGVFDGVFMLLLSPAGIQGAEAIAITLVSRTLQIMSWLPWWVAHIVEGGGLRLQEPYARKMSLLLGGSHNQVTPKSEADYVESLEERR